MMKIEYSWEEIEQLRDIRFRRLPHLRLRTSEDVLDFVNEAGFCFAFAAKKSELPCAWHAACGQRNPVMPVHSHHDENIGLIWSAKDDLPAAKKCYYGKALKKRPTFISLEYFPYFYALSGAHGQSDTYVAQYLRGELSPAARRIMDVLIERSPMVTADLKLNSGFANPNKRYEFDRGIAELQAKFHLVKIAEFYEPFTFLWDLVAHRFSQEIQLAQKLSPKQAREKILAKYFENLLVSNSVFIQRLFGWSSVDIQECLHSLRVSGILTNQAQIKKEKGLFIALTSLCAREQALDST